MFPVCFETMYIVYFIWVVLSNMLFLVALGYAEEDRKMLVAVKFAFDMILFFTLPLLMMIVQGVCK